jgi:hypothetical protein
VDIWGKTFFLSNADVSPRVLQPSLSPALTVGDFNTSQCEIYDTLFGARTSASAQLRGQGNWVHVAIAAEAHVRATHAVAASSNQVHSFTKTSVSWYPECAARRARVDGGRLVYCQSRDEESGRAAWVDTGDASERCGCGIGGGL